MNTKKYLLALLGAACAVSAFADGVRYKDRMFKVGEPTTVTVVDSVPFLDTTNFHGLSSMMQMVGVEPMMYFYQDEKIAYEPLLMDIYQPKSDKAKKRPVVLICHGGAFVAGHKSDKDQKSVTYADSLAARGFVTASLEYRQGVVLQDIMDEKNDQTVYTIDSVDFARTVYRSVQDLSAAIRYLRTNAKTLKIDPDKIYVLGNSAGAMLGLENIYGIERKDYPSYLDDSNFEMYTRTWSEEETTFIYDTLSFGAVDEFGEQGVSGVANGVVALWGAIHDTEIVKNSKVPVFLAHGEADDVLPYKVGFAMEDADAIVREKVPEQYSMIADALHFEIHTPTLYGSYIIDSILTEQEVYHEFYSPLGYDLKHEFYNSTRTGKDKKKIVFADSVQNRVFDFLYKLAIDSLVAPGKDPASIPMLAMVNPSKITMGEGNLSFTVVSGDNLGYAVFDLKGNRMLSGRASMGETVAFDGMNSGVYYLRVQGETARRIVVRK